MKINVSLGIGFAGAIREDEIEIDDSEIEGMNKEEKEDFIEECVQDWANNYIDIGWGIIEN
jgi:hypothetical protein